MKKMFSISAFLLASSLSLTTSADLDKKFPIKILASDTYKQLVVQGRYDMIDEELEEINPKLAKPVQNSVNLVLKEFSDDFLIEELPARLEKDNLRPATLIELLIFGATYPKEQLVDGHPILSPHAVLHGRAYDEIEHDFFVYLRGVEKRRILGAAIAGSFWNKNWRCLAAQLTEAEKQGGKK